MIQFLNRALRVLRTLIALSNAGLASLLLFAGLTGCTSAPKNNSNSGYSGLGKDSVSTEDLKAFAPKPIDAALANRIRKILDVSAPGMGMLSPDNKNLYFSWRVTGQTHIWMVDGPRRFPKQLTTGSDQVTLQAVSRDGQFLIIAKDEGGKENPGLYSLDLKTNQITELFRKEKVNAYFAFLTQDSKFMYFLANDVKPEDFHIYKMELNSNKIERVFEGKGVWSISDYDQDGKRLLLTQFSGARINQYFEWNADDKILKPILGQELSEELDMRFAAQPGRYLVARVDGDFKRLFLFDGKDFRLLSPSSLNWDVESFSIDLQRQRVLYTVNEGGYTKLFALDARTFKPIELPKFQLPGGVKPDHVFSGTTSWDGSMTMLGIVSSQSPRLSYSYDWRTKKLQQWVLPSAPEVDLSQFAVAELMHYEARDGVKIPMFVRAQKKCLDGKIVRCPVVVHFHGGPEGQSVSGFNVYAQALVNEGFVFVDPNVRGSDGYGKKWLESDNGPLRENVITDIEDIAKWIRANWKTVDGSRIQIGSMGWSYGGYSTLMAMSRFVGEFDAGVALVGMSDLRTFLMNTAPFRRVLRISEYGDPEKDKESLKRLSPITYVDQIRDPLMIIQGVNDPRVPAGEALQIHNSLDKKGLKSELVLFADEGHGSSKKENQILELGHLIQFFKQNLRD